MLLANLVRSRIGRSWRAVRDDEVAAALAGLNVARLQVLAFVISAACAGLGGALLAIVAGQRLAGRVHADACPSGCSPRPCSAAWAAWPARSGAACCSSWCPTFLTDFATSHGLSSAASSSVPIAAYGVVLIVVMLVFPARDPGRHAPPVRLRRAGVGDRPLSSLLRRHAPAQ